MGHLATAKQDLHDAGAGAVPTARDPRGQCSLGVWRRTSVGGCGPSNLARDGQYASGHGDIALQASRRLAV
jgi:hypothetical protein